MAALDFPASPTDGQVYTANGVTYVWSAADTAWKGQGSQVPLTNKMRVIAYTGAGTYAYVKPANLKALQVELYGSGGGGGGCSITAATTLSAGGGGGAGGYVCKLYRADELAASESLVLGAGGAAGTFSPVVNGGGGATSTFKGLTATGGSGGSTGGASSVVGATSARGYCGIGSGGDINSSGDTGQLGVRFPHGASSTIIGGYGGVPYGMGTRESVVISTKSDQSAAVMPDGSGGHGSCNGFSQAAGCDGAAGGPAFAVFTEYYAENDTTSGGGGGGDYLPLSGGTLSGQLTAPRVRLTSAAQNELIATDHAFQIGLDTAANMRFDANEIQAVNNGVAATLFVQPDGGLLNLGMADLEVRVNGWLNVGGGQIKFPASQNASADPNTLDDSERGSFTPAVVGTTAAGSGTYTFRDGRYTKIGNKVFFELIASWTAHTGTGNIRISGLPFASIVGSWGPVVSIHADSLTFSGQLSATIPNGQVYLNLATITTNAASGAVAMDTSATLNIAGHYTAA